jgi:hypothetical protein
MNFSSFPFAPEDCTFNELDNYVKSRSNFQTWKEMLSSGGVSNPQSKIEWPGGDARTPQECVL